MGRRLVYMLLTLSVLGSTAAYAQGSAYDRVAYWDGDYGTAWAGDGGPVRDALEAVGYTVVDAEQLKTWMDARISDGKLSVVVMCRDAVPDTVAETQDENCTIRRYLEAGGKVVWYSDIPFYYQTTSGGANTTWGDAGSQNALGLAGSSAPRDTYDDVTLTEDGIAWGLTETWQSRRPTLPDAWDNLTILAVDAAGNAAGWVAHYVEGDTFRGFVRIHDHGDGDGSFSIDNLIAVAEYMEVFTTAMAPVPGEGATDIARDVVLSWTAGDLAASHDVYFGTSFDDVEAASRDNPLGVLVSQGQTATSYDPEGLLEFGQTYYWRVDEVNAAPDNTIFKGSVWSFTAEPFAYAIEGVIASSNLTPDPGAGPENTVNGSGLNADDQHSVASTDMWLGSPSGAEPMYIQYEFDHVYKLDEMLVWNYNVQFELLLGFGVKNVTVEYSEDGANWAVLGDVKLAQATANASYTANTTIDFQGLAAKYVRFLINDGWGALPQYGLSEVRFMYIPAHAREPQPNDGATNVGVDAELTWRAGRDAVSHEVYLGTDPDALELAGTPSAASYNPGALDLGATYYWQVTEIQDAESWAGDMWSFATQEYLVVDDFESYNDEDNLIYETWIDGWTNETGSTVGYLEEPFAERTIVHGGAQSMPLQYDNAGFTTAEADLTLNQNWATNGIQSLSLYFHGASDNSIAQLYVKINGTRVDYAGPAASIRRAAWQLWSIDLSTVGNVSNVNSLTIGVEGADAQGIVYIDDIGLYPEVLADSAVDSPDVTRAGDVVVGVPDDGDWPAAEYPGLVIDDDTATKFLHFKGATEPTGFQVTPLVGATVVTEITFTTANDAAERDPASFELYGSNSSIDGPYTLIASGDIVDFAGATAWPRFTKNETPITFDNSVAYAHYQVLFPTVRDSASANSMQIAEVELIGTATP